jgi:hypothetical protein
MLIRNTENLLPLETEISACLCADDEEILRRIEESTEPGMRDAQNLLYRINWWVLSVGYLPTHRALLSNTCPAVAVFQENILEEIDFNVII